VAALNVPAGRDQLVWGGWSGKFPASSGQYELTIAAQGCGVTRAQAVALRAHELAGTGGADRGERPGGPSRPLGWRQP